ncbi:hypothetical protein HS088_TW20G00332 [Tripterygium wilfordii]|uniref:Subtilisin-like protease fibronectin type-III domain-containing protein n=1 Tax=Tripterygium wilfordii TaxID=458696 RepID=A0A7J7C753_TRIWF|nr:hypothetical protein HS088_TW20G00332 [Tripterygium wilfordii]
MPNDISITVEPPVLPFSSIAEQKSFTVKVNGPKITQQSIMSGAILWKDGVHVGSNPMVN